MTSKLGNASWIQDSVTVGGIELVVRRSGEGKPLLVLHEELGDPGPLGWQEAIAQKRELVLPLHPGFGRTPRVEWISTVRDLAAFYAAFLRSQRLSPIDVIGFSFGGWIAAEIMASDPALVARAVLVAPPGLRPRQSEIFDLFTVTAKKYVQLSVADPNATRELASLFGGDQTPEQFELWEDARAEVARLAWQPYLHDPTLAPRLELVETPATLLVWGREDRLVPREVADLYAKSLPRARTVVLDGCGHRPEIERRDDFVSAVREFLG